MKIVTERSLSLAQKEAIINIWNSQYPTQLKHTDLQSFEDYLSALQDQSHLLLIDEDGHIKGWYFDFLRENERWFAMLLKGEIHGKGYGSLLLNKAKEYRPVLNGWVIDHNNYTKQNGKPYFSPIKFYLKNGFKVYADTRLELAHLSAVKIAWKKNA